MLIPLTLKVCEHTTFFCSLKVSMHGATFCLGQVSCNYDSPCNNEGVVDWTHQTLCTLGTCLTQRVALDNVGLYSRTCGTWMVCSPRMQENVCRGCDVHWARDVWTAGVGTGVPQVLPGQHAQLHLLPTVHAQPQGHLTLMWPPPTITYSLTHVSNTSCICNSKVVFSIHGYRQTLPKKIPLYFHCPCVCSLFKVHSTLDVICIPPVNRYTC